MTLTKYGNPVWIGPLGSATGFGEEGRGFVCSLRRLEVPLAAIPLEREESTFLPVLAQDFPEQIRLLNDAVSHKAVAPVTAIVHTGAAFVPAPPSGVAYAICRTMWETDGLSPAQVATLNTYDEIWVPTTFNQDTFARAGVRAPLVIVPGGVDTSLFRPGVPKLKIPGLRKKVFLSMFEWSHRKAPDVLLRAWAEAFSPTDDVTLLLRCYPRDQFERTDDLAKAIYRRIDEALAQDGLSRADVAPIIVIGQRLSPRQIPALFAAAHCYVAPARGEGWGRPLTEAMAMGLPVIATRWSAPLDFLTDDNALLLDIDGLELVDERMDVPTYRGQRWAAPSTVHLTELLRSVTSDPGGAARLGRQARRDAVQQWQWKRVAEIAAAELERVERQAHRAASRPAAACRPVAEQGVGAAAPPALPGLCTIVTRSYLPSARVLCASLAEHHPGIRPTVLVVDGQYDPDAAVEPFEVIGVDALGIPGEQFAKMALIYSPTELCCALKPWVLAWALGRSPTAVYLDSDVWVGRPLDDAFALAAERGLVLTPHVCHPLPRDGHTPDETQLLAAGIFNLGFVGVGPGSEAFLDFWKERLLDDGIIDQEHMRQADQRWVDFVPGCFPHQVWRDPAANVAYWNLHERDLEEGPDGRPLIDGSPLAFFHFSGFDPRVPGKLSQHQGPHPRVVLGDHPALARLCERYRAELFAAGYRRGALEPYGFGCLPSGEVLTAERRRTYRLSLLAAPATSQTAPPSGAEHASGQDRTSPTLTEAPARGAPRGRPLVSVLVPTRDRERYLAECLSSILEQTYTDLEVIVLDNCSSDASVEIASSFARQDGRLRLECASRDVGLIANHRRGLALASSDLVKFLHDDDVLMPSAIERMVEAITAAPGIAMATTPRTHVDSSGAHCPTQPPPLHNSDEILEGRSVGEAMLLGATNLVGEASTVLFRRGLLGDSPYASFEGRTYDYLTDVSTWLVLLAKGPIAHLAEPLSKTRIHDTQDGRRLGKVREALDWIALAEQAHHHGWLASPADQRAALSTMLSGLVRAVAGDPSTEPERAQLALFEGLERLKVLGGGPEMPELATVGTAQ